MAWSCQEQGLDGKRQGYVLTDNRPRLAAELDHKGQLAEIGRGQIGPHRGVVRVELRGLFQHGHSLGMFALQDVRAAEIERGVRVGGVQLQGPAQQRHSFAGPPRHQEPRAFVEQAVRAGIPVDRRDRWLRCARKLRWSSFSHVALLR